MLTRTQEVDSAYWNISKFAKPSIQIAGPKNIQHKLINWFLRLGHISHSLGRTKYIVIYRMHSGGSDQITNILVYIPTSTHHSALQRKGSVLKSSNNYNKAGSSKRGGSAYLRNAWQCSYSSRIIWLPVFCCFCFWTAFEIKVEIYQAWLHSLVTRLAVALKWYSNVSRMAALAWQFMFQRCSVNTVHH